MSELEDIKELEEIIKEIKEIEEGILSDLKALKEEFFPSYRRYGCDLPYQLGEKGGDEDE